MRNIIHILSPRNNSFHVYIDVINMVITSCIDLQQAVQNPWVSLGARVAAKNLEELTDMYCACSLSFSHSFFELTHL